LVRLRAVDTLPARALEFLVLTAARAGEVLGAKWSEVDWDRKVWTVPPERMKAATGHSVPLSDDAVELLSVLAETRLNEYIFPGQSADGRLCNSSLLAALRRMGVQSVTVHGFRSAFRDFAGDETHFARDVAEAALAHRVGDATERAYRRGSALEKRRQLMQAWADYCSKPKSDNVVQFSR
jgi:integrase